MLQPCYNLYYDIPNTKGVFYMTTEELNLMIEFTKKRKSASVENAPLDFTFIRFVEKLDRQPHVVHELFPIRTFKSRGLVY